MHSQNNNKNIQSAGNKNGSSETIRQLSNVDFSNEEWFRPWLAGIIDLCPDFAGQRQGWRW